MPAALWFAIGRHPLRHNVSLFGNEKIILLQGLHKRPFICAAYASAA